MSLSQVTQEFLGFFTYAGLPAANLYQVNTRVVITSGDPSGANNAERYTDGTTWQLFNGSAGSTTWAALTDKATANLPVDNTALSNALALKATLASPAITGVPTVPTAAPLANTTQIASTAYADAAVAVVAPNAPITVAVGFTFARATHANRRIGYNAAAAGNATFDGTAAFTTDDGFRLMQEGAGAVTLLASIVTFSNPHSYSLVTTGAGTFIDAEWDATIGQLVITGVGSSGGITNLPMGTMPLPSLTWGVNTNTGFYQKSAYELYYSLGGADAIHIASNGDFNLLGGALAVKESANGFQGVATMVAGTVTVSNTSITATSRIIFSNNLAGGTLGNVSCSRVAGTSFTLTSTSATETSTFAYQIFKPAA